MSQAPGRDPRQRCVLWLLAVWLGSCTPPEETSPKLATAPQSGDVEFVQLVTPDLSRMQPGFRTRLQDGHASLMALLDRADVDGGDRGRAYGDLGRLYLAADLPEAAEPCFVNAARLEPKDFRWPYYLGHIYRGRGDSAAALESFQLALERKPGELLTLVWLGRIHQEQANTDRAEQCFQQVLELDPGSSTAHYELGKIAVARRDYVRAVEHLETALRLTPDASIIHYPLALAFRGKGELQQAEQQLEQRGKVEIYLHDPWMEEVRALLASSMVYADRGARAYAAGRWEDSAEAFRLAVAEKPDDPEARVGLGSALFRLGDRAGALEQYDQALRLSPGYARALHSIGALHESAGNDQRALEHYEGALRSEPRYPPTRLRLGHVKRRAGRLEEAIQHYAVVLEIDPRHAEASFGQAMALVKQGRYSEARQRLEEALAVLPDQPAFSHALARLLVASPDDAVRDGPHAMEILQQLAREDQNTDLAETIAMALAELGQYDQAAQWQRKAMEVAERAGGHHLLGRMAERLAAYDRGEPCRVPWHDDDPVYMPDRNAEPALPERRAS